MTPLEKAARALFAIEYPPVDGIAWEDLAPETDRAHYIDCARAVLQAIREPTYEMVIAGEGPVGKKVDCEAVWQAMIDTALNEAT